MAGVVVTGQIGTVEIKDGATDRKAKVSPANIGRNATDNVLLVQVIDATGAVGAGGSGGITELKDGTTANEAIINPANTARLATDNVLLVQTLDAAGNVSGGDANVNIEEVGGVATNVNGGNRDAGTQTVAIADDDNVSTRLTSIQSDINTIAAWNNFGNAKVDINAQNLTAVKVSATAAANATANRIYVNGNLDQVLGTATNVNGGNRDAGTQTVTLADNDKAVTALEIIDDWDDGADHCQVDVAAQTLTAVKVSATAAANTLANPMFTEQSFGGIALAVDNPLWVEQSISGAVIAADNPTFTEISTSGAVVAIDNPVFVNLTDGTDSIAVLATIADDMAVSTNALVTASCMFGYDGATLDMLRVGATGELQVTDVATRAGEDSGNDWRKTKKEEVAVSTPAKTTTTIDEADEVILASVEILNWPNLVITIDNTHGSNAFTACKVQMSPDNTTWEDWDTTTFATLADGAMLSMQITGNSRRYLKILATAASDTGSCDVWLTMNKG